MTRSLLSLEVAELHPWGARPRDVRASSLAKTGPGVHCSCWRILSAVDLAPRETPAAQEGKIAMSGHSKWAQIKRQKGVNDARRGQLFTRLGREIIVAVREGGGGDPDANFRLRMAVQRAREANMPTENIERSIKRALGSGEGAQLDELTYEGPATGTAPLPKSATCSVATVAISARMDA